MMNETNETGDRKLSSGGRTLSLRKTTVEQGRVRQSFSHGRSKTVVVETKRKRAVGAPARPEPAQPQEAKPAAPKTAAAPAAPAKPETERAGAAPRPGVVLRTLTEDEKEARERALADARVREAEERKHAEADARRRADIEERERIEDRKSTRLNSSHLVISYAVFCLTKKPREASPPTRSSATPPSSCISFPSTAL